MELFMSYVGYMYVYTNICLYKNILRKLQIKKVRTGFSRDLIISNLGSQIVLYIFSDVKLDH